MQTKRIEALRVLEHYGIIEEYELPPELADDERFMLLAIGMNSGCIHWIGKELFKNKEFIQMVLTAYSERWEQHFEYSPEVFEEFDPFMESDDKNANSVLRPFYADLIYKAIPEELKADPVIMEELLKRKLKVTELHQTLSVNSDFLINAVKYSPELFQLADETLLSRDLDFIRRAVVSNPSIWAKLSDELKEDSDFQQALVDVKLFMLNHLHNMYLDEEYDQYVSLLPQEILNDKNFAIQYVEQNYEYFKHLGDNLKDDLEVVRAAYASRRGWSSNEEYITPHCSARIQELLEQSNLDPVETLTKAIENKKLNASLNAGLALKDEVKLTARQRKQQSGPVL